MIGYLLFLLAMAGLSGCADVTPQLKQGEPVPAFTLPLLGGGTLAFPADVAGHVVAVRFWADWCPFCDSEMRELEPVYRKYRDRGLTVLAVNVGQAPDTVRKFVDELGISYGTLLDSQGETARRYGVMGLPTTFLIDRQGRLAGRILGESPASTFERMIMDLL